MLKGLYVTLNSCKLKKKSKKSDVGSWSQKFIYANITFRNARETRQIIDETRDSHFRCKINATKITCRQQLK